MIEIIFDFVKQMGYAFTSFGIICGVLFIYGLIRRKRRTQRNDKSKETT